MTDKSIREEHPVEYRAWRNMRQRCLNPKVPNYPRYGGRGITICPQWSDFGVFLADMGLKPAPNRSLERRDNNGNYEPSNCYWATQVEQDNNKERSVKLTYKGRTQSLSQWAKELGMSYEHIRVRHRYGWTVHEIIETPKNKHRKERANDVNSHTLTYCGKTMNIAQWAKYLEVSYDVIRARVRYGWSVEDIIETPAPKRKLYNR